MGLTSRTRSGQASALGKRVSDGLAASASHTPNQISSSSPAAAAKTRSSSSSTRITDSVAPRRRASPPRRGVPIEPTASLEEDIIPEIIVKIDDMEFIDMVDSDSDSIESSSIGSPVSNPPSDGSQEPLQGLSQEMPRKQSRRPSEDTSPLREPSKASSQEPLVELPAKALSPEPSYKQPPEPSDKRSQEPTGVRPPEPSSTASQGLTEELVREPSDKISPELRGKGQSPAPNEEREERSPEPNKEQPPPEANEERLSEPGKEVPPEPPRKLQPASPAPRNPDPSNPDQSKADPTSLQLPTTMATQTTKSLASSASTFSLTEPSDLSAPSHSLSPSGSSKATTPVDRDISRDITSLEKAVPPNTLTLPHPTPPHKRSSQRRRYDVRPKVSVPPDLAPSEYAMQCIVAAETSRLNPYALHQEEYLMLREHISHAQVTTYLNIRNGILRLWVRNPQIAVARDEAVGCAKDSRWFDVASVCYDWLVRQGYINFGCVHIRRSRKNSADGASAPKGKRRRVVVIGAGMSGLGCARQLECLFNHCAKQFRDAGEDIPEVVVLEGRNRIGGRVYSRAFQHEPAEPTRGFENRRTTAEMGGMIITGFDRGNPLNILVRGQLCLPYYALRSDMKLYDSNGKPVDPVRDDLIEKIYNDCLERVSEFKFKTPSAKLIEGNRDLMDEGRDSSAEGHKTIAFVEETTAAQPHAPPVAEQNIAPQVDLVPVSSDRMTGRTHSEPGTAGTFKAAYKAKMMGWALKAGVSEKMDIDLDAAAEKPGATLGSVLEEAVTQYKDLIDLNAQDYRLINWHWANLEYSNAVNLNQLSLQGWDIDAGNEWDGKHTMVVGGYQAVPRGLMLCPTPLTVHRNSPVKSITYSKTGALQAAAVECEDGQVFEADFVVSSIPLGVLKHGNVEFQPPLPAWKADTIDRLGWGVLNKVILVYNKPFWNEHQDIFGVLRTPNSRTSLNQKDYASKRGRLFQWFNVSNTTGLPCLLGLMAGDAAYQTEQSCNDDLVREATEILRNVFGHAVPDPVESIVTRWASDKFARGSYSSAGPDMKADDYDSMARPIGNLFFAGEHTTGSHPATVHGAYLSGLRAASEVVEAMLGPIQVPTPLVVPKESSSFSLKRKALEESNNPAKARLDAYEVEIWTHIRAQLGDRPYQPAKIAGNAYLLFNKANYEAARKKCEEGRRPGKGRPGPNECRAMTSKMWKDAGPEARRPFEEQAEEQKRAYGAAMKEFGDRVLLWDRRAVELRTAYEKDHPSLPTPEEVAWLAGEMAVNPSRRTRRVVETYAESDSDEDMVGG